MFKNEIKSEIKNSFFRIGLILIIDIFWIAGMYLIFKPLVYVGIVYAVFSITMIYPQISIIKLLIKIKSIYKNDKSKAHHILNSNVDNLKEVVKSDPTITTNGDFQLNSKSEIRRDIANRRSMNNLKRKYILFVRLNDIILNELKEEKKHKENEFS